MIAETREILTQAREQGIGVGAFNVSSLEQIKAVLAAAEAEHQAVIIETSEGEAEYLGKKLLVNVVKDLAQTLKVKVAIHLDHGKKPESIKEAIEAGYGSVHFDGSGLLFDDNLAATRQIVDLAHSQEKAVEGEFTLVGGSSEYHKGEIDRPGELTEPKEAVRFIAETGVDIFAGGYGNIHGLYQVEPRLEIERIREIASSTEAFLSLHGGSGIGREQIRAAIKAGISKINVNTELRLAYRQGLSRVLNDHPEEVVPYRLLPEVIAVIQEVVAEKIRLFSGR